MAQIACGLDCGRWAFEIFSGYSSPYTIYLPSYGLYLEVVSAIPIRVQDETDAG